MKTRSTDQLYPDMKEHLSELKGGVGQNSDVHITDENRSKSDSDGSRNSESDNGSSDIRQRKTADSSPLPQSGQLPGYIGEARPPPVPAAVRTTGYAWLFGACVVVVLMAVACGLYYLNPELFGADSASKEDSANDRWVDAVSQLRVQFRRQPDTLWEETRAAVNRMLNQQKQPATLVLLGGEEQAHELRCLAVSVAEALRNATGSNATGSNATRALQVDAASYTGLTDQLAKRQLNELLEQLLGGQPREEVTTVIVHNLQLLKPLSAMLFQGFCDNDNARRPSALFVFDVRVPRHEVPVSEERRADVLEAALWKSWGADLSPEVFDALLARIGGNVVTVSGENDPLPCGH